MKTTFLKNTGLFILSAVFSIGLMFAFIELPALLDGIIQDYIQTPHTDPAYDAERIELFYEAYSIRLLGYICLAIILLMIIIGFATRRRGWALLGSLLLFLPVFATFAHSMFFLAGLGLFNVIVFPLLDVSSIFLDFGRVVLIPHWVLLWIFGLFDYDANELLIRAYMIIGAFIFILGVFAWMRTRYGKTKVATHWIYKYSRHPQYLGWIIWSYGLMLYGPTLNQMKKSWGWHSTLPWLLATMVILGLCMLEELKMKKIAGEEYENYRKSTPFLFPLPGILIRILKAPGRLLIGKKYPVSRWEVGGIVLLYTAILVGTSAIWVDFDALKRNDENYTLAYDPIKVSELVSEIKLPQAWKYRKIDPYTDLIAMGPETYPELQKIINDPNPEIRELCIQAVSERCLHEFEPALIHALNDPAKNVAHAAVRGLGSMKATTAKDTLWYAFQHPETGLERDLLLQALSHLQCQEIMPYLIDNYDSAVDWWQYSFALTRMIRVDAEATKPYLYEALKNDHHRVRRDAVYLILEYLPEDAIPHLELVLDDENWDVRFYARQAIDLIKERQDKPIE